MRRILFGLLWFVAFTMPLLFVLSMLVALVACEGIETFDGGYDCGKAAVEAFMARFRLPVAAASLLLTAVATWAGVLPGTRPRSRRRQ